MEKTIKVSEQTALLLGMLKKLDDIENDIYEAEGTFNMTKSAREEETQECIDKIYWLRGKVSDWIGTAVSFNAYDYDYKTI